MATPPLDDREHGEFTPPRDYGTDRSSGLRFILSHINIHLHVFLAVIVFTIGNSILQSSIPQYIGQIFDLFDQGKLTLDDLQSLSLIVLVLGVAAGIVTLFRNFTSQLIAQRIERNARDELYSSLLAKDLGWHDQQKIGDLMTRATQDVRQLNMMFNPGFNLVFQSIVSIIIPIIFISFIDPVLIVVPLVYTIIFVIVLYYYNQTQAPYAMKTRQASSETQSRLNETISGMFVVRSSSQENKEREIFDENITEFKNAQIKLGEIRAKYWPLLIFGAATALAILHGVYLVEAGTISIGQLIQFVLLFQLLRFPTFINIFAITVLTLGLAAASRIIKILTDEVDLDQNEEGYAEPIKGEIKYENVTFGYNEENPVLEDISFTVQPGDTVALVGITGSGKTTVTKLLARLYDPQEGRILVDGVDLKDWSMHGLRNQMALVEQDIFLFSKSIKENILLGNPDASMDEIIDAAKLAHAHEFIMDMKDGYDTEIGERGTQLSGGQKQRVAIARAIVKDPNLLILDDASSAIDSETEDQINKAIRDVLKDRVSFLITHRIAQIRRADLIILLEEGRIVDKGSHNELLKKSERYRSIFSIYDGFEEKVENLKVQQEEQ